MSQKMNECTKNESGMFNASHVKKFVSNQVKVLFRSCSQLGRRASVEKWPRAGRRLAWTLTRSQTVQCWWYPGQWKHTSRLPPSQPQSRRFPGWQFQPPKVSGEQVNCLEITAATSWIQPGEGSWALPSRWQRFWERGDRRCWKGHSNFPPGEISWLQLEMQNAFTPEQEISWTGTSSTAKLLQSNITSDYQDIVCHSLSENLYFQYISQYLFSFPAQNFNQQPHGNVKVHLSRSGWTRAT